MKLEDIPTPIVWALNTLSRMNGDRTTVLHLDRSIVLGIMRASGAL